MNIFVLDPDAATSARMMCDKHVVKMILESCQLLSTAHHVLDGDIVTTKGKKREYKTYSNGNMNICRCTMINHPCTIWTRETRANYLWLWKHAHALCKEYTRRYGKVHAMEKMLDEDLFLPPKNITKAKLTPFAQAMPEQYKNSDAAIAYRNYYIHEKARFAKWKFTEEPEWFSMKQPEFLLYADLPF
jgi:hypothetical protein